MTAFIARVFGGHLKHGQQHSVQSLGNDQLPRDLEDFGWKSSRRGCSALADGVSRPIIGHWLCCLDVQVTHAGGDCPGLTVSEGHYCGLTDSLNCLSFLGLLFTTTVDRVMVCWESSSPTSFRSMISFQITCGSGAFHEENFNESSYRGKVISIPRWRFNRNLENLPIM